MSGWWVEVDGFVLPRPISGHPALEFCNTRAAWGERYEPRQEYLRSYAHLVMVAREAGVLERDRAATLLARAERETPAMAHEVERARSLRADAHAAITGDASAAAFRRVADWAGAARSRQVLVRDADGHRWTWPGAPKPGEPLDALLLAVAALLVSDDVRRVRACPGHGCGWLFLDTTGRRRWCQMAVCGNRAKQARIRERHHVGRPTA